MSSLSDTTLNFEYLLLFFLHNTLNFPSIVNSFAGKYTGTPSTDLSDFFSDSLS